MAKINVAFGALAGAVAGFVTGILIAPKSGKETRQDIKKGAVKAKDTSLEKVEEVKDKATKVAGDVAGKAKNVANDVESKAKGVVKDVEAKAKDVKGRVEQAIDGAQKGYAKSPQRSAAAKTSSKKK